MEINAFLTKYGTLLAQKCIARNILPSPAIAQMVIESDKGESELALNAHALFGIKLHPWEWTKGYSKLTKESYDGVTLQDVTALFRAYDSWEQSIDGYVDFICNHTYGPNSNIKVYSRVIGIKDYTMACKMLKECGYATAPNYVSTLTNTIVKYNLTKFDNIKQTPSIQVTKYTVGIDAGHGSNTAGKRTAPLTEDIDIDGDKDIDIKKGQQYREHYFNVMVATHLAQMLNSCGIKVCKSGWDDENATDDVDTPLAQRQGIIKNANCDISISIHANASGSGLSFNNGNGVETLIHENNSYISDSMKLANCIQKSLMNGTKQTNRGVKRQQLAMCNCSAMKTKASVLTELGFMTNEHEAQDMLANEKFCIECADELCKGICGYLGVQYVKSDTTSSFDNANKTSNSKLPYKVRVSISDLNVRKSPCVTNSNRVCYCPTGVFTITEESNGWGKLKSGLGWIKLSYTTTV